MTNIHQLPTLKIYYLRNKTKNITEQENFEDFKKNIFYTLLSNYFIIEHNSFSPDIIFEDFHFHPKTPKSTPSIIYMHEAFTPDFNLHDFGIGFDRLHIQTRLPKPISELNMTTINRYTRFPYWLYQYPLIDIKNKKVLDFPAVSKNDAKELLSQKTQFCNFLVSNSLNADPTREYFFHALNKYKTVSSGGKLLNNVGRSISSISDFYSKGKFSIAFENNSKSGYTTEKLINAFYYKTIPIYWGAQDVAQEFNPNTFINCHDYNSFDEVIKRVKKIDNDDDLWCEIISMSPKIYANKANLLLKQLDKFLYQIGTAVLEYSKEHSQKLTLTSCTPHSKKALELWNILSKQKLSSNSFKKTCDFFLSSWTKKSHKEPK